MDYFHLNLKNRIIIKKNANKKGMLKMKYGVEYRNMHTGVHGVLVVQEEETADMVLATLNQLSQGLEEDATIELEKMEFVMEHVYADVDDLHYKDIKEKMTLDYEINCNGRVSVEESIVTIINANQAVDVFGI